MATPKLPPYELPPLPKLDPATIKKIDQRDIKRFFRIEALLRSPEVWDLYQKAIKHTRRRKTCPPITNTDLWISLFGENRLKTIGKAHAPMRRLLWDTSLCERFHVEDGWAVLLGTHERYLRPQNISFRIGEGIVDLSIMHRSKDLSFKLEYLNEDQSRYLYLMIDSAEVSLSDLRALQDLVRKRQKTILFDAKLQAPHPIKDVTAWMLYLRSYDMHRYQGVSAENVGKNLHGAPGRRLTMTPTDRNKCENARRQALRACANVQKLIDSAVKGPWVPSLL